jgi:hypothetical protein
MRVISHRVEVLSGVPQRRYVIHLLVGDEAAARVIDALGDERIDWRPEWGKWQPFAKATFEKLVAEFERRRARPSIDDVNAELALKEARSQGVRRPADRQLPVCDRVA